MAKKSSSSRGRITKDEIRLFRKTIGSIKSLPDRNEEGLIRKRLIKNSSSPLSPEGILRPGNIFFRAGLSEDNLESLCNGLFYIDKTIDLHGMSVSKATRYVKDLIDSAALPFYQCFLIITGQGLHSPEGYSQIKENVMISLKDLSQVHAFAPALQKDGGQGALYVLFRR